MGGVDADDNEIEEIEDKHQPRPAVIVNKSPGRAEAHLYNLEHCLENDKKFNVLGRVPFSSFW